MLLGEEHDLRNRIMHVDWNKVENETISQSANHEVQSAKAGEELPPKCKNCTLEEVALLRIVQKNPSATQKEIALEIGKSERTVKTITIALQEKNILRRVNGKRNGYWEFVEDSIQQERLIIINLKFSHTSTRTSSIEIQSFSDYVKSNSLKNTHVHVQGRDHWYGSGNV